MSRSTVFTIRAFRGAAFLLAAGLLLSGCSSAPKAKPGSIEVKKQAASYAASGTRFYTNAQYAEALTYFQLSLDENMRIFNEEGMADSWNSIGMVERATGDIEAAEKSYRNAVEIAGKTGNGKLLARSRNNLAEILLERGQNREALTLFQEARTGIDEKTDEAIYAVLIHNTGIAWKNLGDYQKALTNLELALKVNTKLENVGEMASNHYAISSIYLKLENYTKAMEHAREALKNDQAAENSAGIAQDLYAMGVIREKAGNREEAYGYYKQSYLVYSTIRYRSGTMKILSVLKETAARMGKKEEADTWSKELETLTGSKHEG